ncbi:MAG TPA: class I SAM-dependent methyltransferase [Solirubrobacteraceae bacterium]|jgi:SAM-dependent methyltransferase|nr:class I SAM-dependent methyltransferase [Solirubrobacteraceae bacterium]
MPGTDDARERWNERYARAAATAFPDSPAEWLVEHRALLDRPAARLRALDVACGDGRNARFLAELGYAVDALDISDVVVDRLSAAAVSDGLTVTPRVADLERTADLPEGRYDVIVNFNYLQRSLFAGLARALRPGGLLLFETFGRSHVDELGNELRPEFVLGDNELIHAFPDLRVRHYREGVAQRSGRPRGVASLVAERRSERPAV